MFGSLNKFNYLARTGNRQFEFERLYLDNQDPWNYFSSTYEAKKYRHSLDRILNWRRGHEFALEIGCSVGVFSGMLADQFGTVTAIDISKEVLAIARRHNEGKLNLRFLKGDLRSLELQTEFDTIVCAEVLYYIKSTDAELVCSNLSRHLKANGIIITVAGMAECDPLNFGDGDDIFGVFFDKIFGETIEDPLRPYKLNVFTKR